MAHPVRIFFGMLRKVPSKSLLRTIHTSTQKPNPSHLLSNSTSQYQAMSVNALKTELKSRRLPISGRKADLIDRLSTFDARRNLSATSAPQAKGDESHIDFFHIPEKKAEPKTAKIRIPAPPDQATVAKEIDVQVTEPPVPDAGATSSVVNSVGGRDVSSMNTDLGDPAEYEENQESESIPSRDKTILTGIAAGIALFWGGDAIWKRSKDTK